MAEAKSDAPITGGRIQSIERDGVQYPALIFKGEVPRKGAKLRATFDGVTYEATVHAAVEADGEVLAETSGFTPLDAPEAT